MRSRSLLPGVVLAATAALSGCAWQGPSLAGHEGLQWQVISYYGARALEEGAMCPQPQITAVTRARVLEETPERVVMRLDYHYRDETMDVQAGDATVYGCDGFGERDFTFARSTASGLDVLAMTGPQRGR